MRRRENDNLKLKISPQIIFEDEFLLVIDKPPGLVVNRAETTAKAETIQDFAEFKISNLKFKIESQTDKEFKDRGGIVHRLDKDTSGLLVIAKTPEVFENLKNQFKGREVVKKYLALVHGKVEPSEGTIEAPIERSPFNRKHFGVFPGGREAVTEFKILRYLRSPRGEFTLLEITPHTGRTHQIRVHMKYIGHPIVSDPIYGGRKNLREDLKWCSRLFLQAKFLLFRHPENNQEIELEIPLAKDLGLVLKRLAPVNE